MKFVSQSAFGHKFHFCGGNECLCELFTVCERAVKKCESEGIFGSFMWDYMEFSSSQVA